MSFGKNDVNLRIGATDKTRTAFNSAENRMKRLAGSAKTLAGSLGAMFGIYSGVRLFSAGLQSAVEFDKAIREVNSLMNLTGDEFQAFKKDILDVSKALGVDAVVSAKAAYQAISAGVPRKNLTEFLTTSSKAAIAGLVDTETSVNALTNAVNAYGLTSDAAGQMADAMFAAVVEGKTTFGELSESMYLAAPMAATLGVRFEELMASVSAITKRGAPTSAAFTQIRSAMVALQKPTADMQAVFDSLGFSTGNQMIASKGYQGALSAIREEAERLGINLSKVFGRVEAQNAVFNLTGEAANEYTRILQETTDASGKMAEAFEVNNESVSRSVERVSNKLKAVGTESLDFWVKLYDDIKKKKEEIDSWEEKFKETPKKINAFGAWVTLEDLKRIKEAAKLEEDSLKKNPSNWKAPLVAGEKERAEAVKETTAAIEEQSEVVEKNLTEQESALDRWVRYNMTKQEMVVHAMQNASDSMTDAFMEFTTTGKLEFDSFVNSMLQSIARLTFQQSVANPIAQGLSGIIGGFFGGGASSGGASSGGASSGGATAGAKAAGGPVYGGRSYLVGEKGPEIMTTKSSGTVIPNDKISGGGTTINFNVTAIDSASFSQHLATHRREITGIVETAYNRRGRKGPMTS
jgi:TP901 family phage tail tape measure protein